MAADRNITNVTNPGNKVTDKKTLRRVAMASIIGATIEWYDFFLYGVVASIVLNKLYFPTGDPATSTMLAYATFAVGFMARPLGGVIFGHFGDKVGRKSMLVITLMIMGVSTVAIGLIPTYNQIGYWAPALLLFFRIIQGIGLGGEWGGAVLMAYEYAPSNRRGFYTSLPQIGLSLGVLISAGFVAGLSALLTEEQFMAWGWRLGFVLSFGLVLFGLWIRLKVMETPEFAQLKQNRGEAKIPFTDMIKRFPGNILLGLGARHIDGVFFNIFSVFSISYLTKTIGMTRTDALIGVMIGAAVLTVFIPIFGRLSDKVGRPALYTWASILTGLSCFPAFWIMSHAGGNTTLIWAAIAVPFGIIYAAVYGTVAVFLCELFDARVRYTGISFVYQFSSVIAGGVTPIVATILLTMNGGKPWLICSYVLGTSVVSSICAYAIRRRAVAARAAGVEHYGEIQKTSQAVTSTA
ncbi:MFS transporter [Glaciimonas sp. Gout2]|uniref:MFS transporter n=2 Tax=Glaciimonas TaxID=1229970 RepID=UPI002AB562BC|nr:MULTISPECIES: MFS transporter [unclassified Glaciimonas]MDY7548279.1 MFS transporter [Glaciimonas sp. CA11.2]MEB0010570.1 MFS transporter [Glaciimonas sp. Cout2]MEB0084436.1 MFS transporter [Glaciimonas sp. Gout2]